MNFIIAVSIDKNDNDDDGGDGDDEDDDDDVEDDDGPWGLLECGQRQFHTDDINSHSLCTNIWKVSKYQLREQMWNKSYFLARRVKDFFYKISQIKICSAHKHLYKAQLC